LVGVSLWATSAVSMSPVIVVLGAGSPPADNHLFTGRIQLWP
jgi:hypothetical protein